VGNAFSFNGTNQYVDLPTGANIPIGNATYTLLAWIKPNAAGTEGIIGYGNYGTNNQVNAFRLLDDGTGHLNFRHYWWGNDLDAFTNIPANSGAWHLAVAEFDGTTRTIVLDGAVIAMDTPTGHNVPNTANFRIGSTNLGEYFNGLIDEAQVYNRALTPAEIQAIYGAGAAGQVKGVRVQTPLPVSITTVSRSAAAINEGSTLTLSATFADQVTGQTHLVVVSWGDGSANTMLTLAAGTFTFSTNHLYIEEGNFEIHLTVSAADTRSDTVLLPVSAASVAPPTGLVGWWTGDGTNPTIAPDAAGSNPGTLVNGVTYAPGEVGNAFSFNGVNQYVNLPTGTNIPVGNATYTLMAWIRPNAAGNEGIIGYGNYGSTNQVNAFRLVDDGTGHLNLLNYWWANDLQATTNLPATGAWHLAVAEFDGTTRRIVLDGQVIAMDTPTGHNVPNTANFRIGSTNLGEYFNGLIDEAQVFNRALTLAEIQAIYGAGSAGEIKGVQVAPLVIHFLISGFPSPTVAGAAGGITVTAQNQLGDTVSSYRGTVHFSSSDLQAVLPADYTFTDADNGQHMFSVTLKTAGTQSITATDTATPAFMGTESGIVVNSAALSVFAVTGIPSPWISGDLNTFAVSAKDAFGNTVTGYRGTLHLSSSDPRAILSRDYTFTAQDAGQHTLGAVLYTVGTATLTAADAVADLSNTQAILVNPAFFVVSGFPSPVTAGQSGTFTVTAFDGLGRVATGYTGVVRFTSTDNQAMLPGAYTFTTGDAGVHSFIATLKMAGAQSIVVADMASSLTSGEQDNILVRPGTAFAFVISGYPSTVTAGSVHSFTVTVVDQYGNTVTDYGGTVHFSSSDPLALVHQDYTFSAEDGGQHTFRAALGTLGTQWLEAVDTVMASLHGRQDGIQVVAG
jgi:hypothetical protein